MPTRDDATFAGGAMPPAGALAEPGSKAAMVKVWDPFVRIFHWSMVSLFALAYATGDEVERLHLIAGYGIMGLLAFRLLWGFVGSPHARFSDFVRTPREIVTYLGSVVQNRAPRSLGHNPAGGAMVVALLAMLSAIAATGFMMTTDAFWGAEWVEELHEGLVNATLGLVVLHVAGVFLTGRKHGENLAKAMITGRKRAS